MAVGEGDGRLASLVWNWQQQHGGSGMVFVGTWDPSQTCQVNIYNTSSHLY